MREIYMTDGFFEHLRQHAVPLNENAIRQLRDSATALDLYTWLAYRLPRINPKRPTSISWQQMAVHFGNDGKNIRKFRQTVRDAWERHVSAVYPEAKADFDTTLIRLYTSPAPLQQKLISGARLRIVADDEGTPSAQPAPPDIPARFMAAMAGALKPAEARAWLKDVTLEQVEGAWVLLAHTRFVAHWIATQFNHALRHATTSAGLTEPPAVRARSGQP
jgi:Plasmid encoded RepA protein